MKYFNNNWFEGLSLIKQSVKILNWYLEISGEAAYLIGSESNKYTHLRWTTIDSDKCINFCRKVVQIQSKKNKKLGIWKIWNVFFR